MKKRECKKCLGAGCFTTHSDGVHDGSMTDGYGGYSENVFCSCDYGKELKKAFTRCRHCTRQCLSADRNRKIRSIAEIVKIYGYCNYMFKITPKWALPPHVWKLKKLAEKEAA